MATRLTRLGRHPSGLANAGAAGEQLSPRSPDVEFFYQQISRPIMSFAAGRIEARDSHLGVIPFWARVWGMVDGGLRCVLFDCLCTMP